MYQDATGSAPRIDNHRPGLNWRHWATVLLLLVALPVFAVAALACLPVLALGAAVQGVRQVVALKPGVPLHAPGSANAR